MEYNSLSSLAALPTLSVRNVALRRRKCKICGGWSLDFDVVDFNKYCSRTNCYSFGFSGVPICYVRCEICGFIFTEFFDNWSDQEFQRFIYNEDYIKVDGAYAIVRPDNDAKEWARRLVGSRTACMLDYGSGTGIFADRMCSAGFNVKCYDPFSSPQRPAGKFDIVTCIEVLEHSSNPGQTLQDMKSFLNTGGCILFQTGIQPADILERRCSWWYISPRNGHVSIYTIDALAHLAENAGFLLHTGSGPHAFAPRSPSPAASAALNMIGPWLRIVRLGAPSGSGAELGWHGVEETGQRRFRWTQTERIEWQLSSRLEGVGRVKVTIPFVMEVEPGFAARSTLTIGSYQGGVTVEQGNLTATVETKGATISSVSLTTPPLRKPSELRGTPDRRPLGLAIGVSD